MPHCRVCDICCGNAAQAEFQCCPLSLHRVPEHKRARLAGARSAVHGSCKEESPHTADHKVANRFPIGDTGKGRTPTRRPFEAVLRLLCRGRLLSLTVANAYDHDVQLLKECHTVSAPAWLGFMRPTACTTTSPKAANRLAPATAAAGDSWLVRSGAGQADPNSGACDGAVVPTLPRQDLFHDLGPRRASASACQNVVARVSTSPRHRGHNG